ncbi:MAG: polysulfide reductase NrfD [Actinobacteria bacterium]|nr:polysulfide reductase NrfD [Actinomycetota bacterium]
MKKHYWTWPIATYLFLGGLGGGILLMTIILDLAFGVGETLPMGVLVAIACLGIGCGLLIFELGQPKLA